ncbi:helix-turn-helix domain-containing protein [Methylophilus sp. 14]|uniref:helix-turn-helix domain-containing protein n=1 Tax=Methylophilus sp. 14 TaxID=2781019 RepID=UPI00188F79EF|nr:helix-turn-helix transcriptional regulator [Methylophilus sp. 14]MBF4989464.1 helix-turn-helix transcriptional regulator [Methylophilus sp. 14]
MELQEALGEVFAQARKSVKLTQEDFETVSPRTYISHLERGLSSPTIDKLDQLAGLMGVHAVSLLFQAYLKYDKSLDALQLMAKILEDSKTLSESQNKV